MTEHKFTDDEIIRALENCADGSGTGLIRATLDLIKRYKAEIERLEKHNIEYARKHYQDGRAEAIKEFAERLIKKCDSPHWCVWMSEIEDLVKEMTGEATEPTKVSSGDICVVCGDQVPEGRQVCYMCENSQEFLNKKKE